METLWDREHSKGSTAYFSFQTFLEACCDLAIAMIRRGASTSVHLDFAIKHLSPQTRAEQMLQLMQSASLVQTAKNGRFVQFTHKMLLDYFGAEYLRAHSAEIEALVPRPQIMRGLRASRPADEVLHILLDLVSPETVLEPLVRKDPLLAAELIGAVAEDRKVEFKIQRDLVDALAATLGYKSDREASVHALSRLSETDLRAVHSLFTHDHKWVRRSAVQALGRINKPEVISLLIPALGDSDRWVRKDAGAVLAGLKGEARVKLEQYIAEELRRLYPQDRQALGEELLAAFGPTEVGMRALIVAACGIEIAASNMETLPPPSVSRNEHKVRQMITSCSKLLSRSPDSPELFRKLKRLLKWPALPDVLHQSICDLGISWLNANLIHDKFSIILSDLLRVVTPGRQEREELLRLMIRRWRKVPPGLRGFGVRNRILMQLLGMPGEVTSTVAVALTDALLGYMNNMRGRKIVSADVLHRLENDLFNDPGRRIQVEKALLELPPRADDPGEIPEATEETKALIGASVAACQAMLPVVSLSPQAIRPLIETAEGLVSEGHVFRSRHVIARLLLLVYRCPEESLRERVLVLCSRAVSEQRLTENQLRLFATACYRVADQWASEPLDVLLMSLGLERPTPK